MANRPKQPAATPAQHATTSPTGDIYTDEDRLRLLLLALFDSEDGEQALGAMKEASKDGKPFDTRSARKVLSDILIDVIFKHPIEELKQQFQSLRETVDCLANTQAELLGKNSEAILKIFLPHGALRNGYSKDHSQEKADLGRYVAKNFFRGVVRCFVQASTTAIHFGEQLIENQSLDHCLFYTNSIVFPITVLRENALHSVYAFCGGIYDPTCGAWLFPLEDSETEERLKELFRRPTGRLTRVFLMPRAVTVDEGLLYERRESAHLARILLRECEDAVIMVTSDRVCRTQNEATIPTGMVPATACQFETEPKDITLVVSSAADGSDMDALAPEFRSRGMHVAYQKTKTVDEWRELRADGSTPE